MNINHQISNITLKVKILSSVVIKLLTIPLLRLSPRIPQPASVKRVAATVRPTFCAPKINVLQQFPDTQTKKYPLSLTLSTAPPAQSSHTRLAEGLSSEQARGCGTTTSSSSPAPSLVPPSPSSSRRATILGSSIPNELLSPAPSSSPPSLSSLSSLHAPHIDTTHHLVWMWEGERLRDDVRYGGERNLCAAGCGSCWRLNSSPTVPIFRMWNTKHILLEIA
jgi:hypothetical protein